MTTPESWIDSLPPALLETWRADADRWQRLHGCSASKVATPTDGSNPVVETVVDVLSQRLGTLIVALTDTRWANDEYRRELETYDRLEGDDQHPDESTLEAWKLEAVAGSRESVLIDALRSSRYANVELGRVTLEKATELEGRLEGIKTELARLAALQDKVSALRDDLFGQRPREAFSSAPVEISSAPVEINYWCPSAPTTDGKCVRDAIEAVCRWCNRAMPRD